MVSWTTIKTLLFTLGPLVLPRLIAYYRSVRSSGAAQNVPIRPIPAGIKRALNILFISALIALLSTLAVFHPANIFTRTGSRLQIPNDVLFVRLGALRPLTGADDTLKSKFASLDARLLYLAVGPDPLVNCRFCHSDDPNSFLYYALPSILTPHLLHIGLLGLVTSSLVSGHEATIWRTQATVAGTALAACDVFLRASYDFRANSRATRLADVDFFHWRMLTYRGLSIALVDLFLAYMLYLSSTHRAFVSRSVAVVERLAQATRTLESTNRKLQALGITRNAILRDDKNLRATAQAYWHAEATVMRDVFENRDVLDAVRHVLNRLDLPPITAEAEAYADAVVQFVQPHQHQHQQHHHHHQQQQQQQHVNENNPPPVDQAIS